MRVFLASIPLPGTTVVVVGEGSAAAAKARLFDGSGADVRWFSGPAAQAENAIPRWPTEPDLNGARLVFIAVADNDLRDLVATWGRACGAQVNVVDQPALSDFHTPALIDRDGVVVGIATAEFIGAVRGVDGIIAVPGYAIAAEYQALTSRIILRRPGVQFNLLVQVGWQVVDAQHLFKLDLGSRIIALRHIVSGQVQLGFDRVKVGTCSPHCTGTCQTYAN